MKVLTNKKLHKLFKGKVDNKMRAFGDTDLVKKIIRVNKKMSKKPSNKRPLHKNAHKYPELLDTIHHEVSHAIHPNKLEKNIRKHTKKTIKTMSRKVKQKYYRLFS